MNEWLQIIGFAIGVYICHMVLLKLFGRKKKGGDKNE